MREIEGFTAGRIVHYVPQDGESFTDVRPAIIVRAWDPGSGCANLQVFLDGTNDGSSSSLLWVTSRLYSEEPKPGTWHWIPRA